MIQLEVIISIYFKLVKRIDLYENVRMFIVFVIFVIILLDDSR